MNNSMTGEEPKSGGIGVLPTLLAVAALGAGIAGIFIAVNARKTIDALRSELADQRAAATVAQETVRTLGGNSERLFGQVAQQLTVLNDRLNTLAGRVAALNSPPKPAPAEPAGLPPAGMAPPVAATPAAPAPAAAPAGSYTVEAGDNFSRIAKKLNVTVAAMEKANPDVNPSKLKIGQKIRVP